MNKHQRTCLAMTTVGSLLPVIARRAKSLRRRGSDSTFRLIEQHVVVAAALHGVDEKHHGEMVDTAWKCYDRWFSEVIDKL